MVRVLRVCLAFVSVVLIVVASAGCGPQEKEPATETPVAEPGTPPESPTPAQPGAAAENLSAGEQQGTNIEIDPIEDDIWPAGSASARR